MESITILVLLASLGFLAGYRYAFRVPFEPAVVRSPKYLLRRVQRGLIVSVTGSIVFILAVAAVLAPVEFALNGFLDFGTNVQTSGISSLIVEPAILGSVYLAFGIPFGLGFFLSGHFRQKEATRQYIDRYQNHAGEMESVFRLQNATRYDNWKNMHSV
ncbi:MAG: hypothetical protein CL946_13715 [Ectothiorhodospiraceae bacterium]|nr:hypothetical protein [Ectothiorhodospiraceae bacterium]